MEHGIRATLLNTVQYHSYELHQWFVPETKNVYITSFMRVADWYTVEYIRIATSKLFAHTDVYEPIRLYLPPNVHIQHTLTEDYRVLWRDAMQFGRRFERNCLIYLQGGRSVGRENSVNDRERERERHGERASGKRRNIKNSLNGVTSQKTVIFAFTTVRKPNLLHQMQYWIVDYELKSKKNGILHSIGISMYTAMKRRLFPCKIQFRVDTNVLYCTENFVQNIQPSCL
jgi:hypothetical protein